MFRMINIWLGLIILIKLFCGALLEILRQFVFPVNYGGEQILHAGGSFYSTDPSFLPWGFILPERGPGNLSDAALSCAVPSASIKFMRDISNRRFRFQ